MPYVAGEELALKPEFIDGTKQLKRLDDVPDVLPFKLKQDAG
jgi:hypothetical protein